MTISLVDKLTLQADITPADALASGTYRIGFTDKDLALPATADVVYSVDLTTSVTPTALEVDVNNWGGAGVVADPDGGVVSIDQIYALAILNNDAAISVDFSGHSTLQSFAGRLGPGDHAMITMKAGVTLGASSDLTLTAVSGTPSVTVLVIGLSN